MSENDKCICYVNMTIEELSHLPEHLLVEGIVGSIPTLFKEKSYVEVIKRVGIAPGGKDKLLEILRKNEAEFGFNEQESPMITKLHASNLYHMEEAVLMSLHAVIKMQFYKKNRMDIETVKAVTALREEGYEFWKQEVQKGLLGDSRLEYVSEFENNTEKIFMIAEIFGLPMDPLVDHARNLIEKNKKEYPADCIKLAAKLGIAINVSECATIADELLKNANSQVYEFHRKNMTEKAANAYDALDEIGRLPPERKEILEAYRHGGFQYAIKKASKVLKTFTYIPRGKWDKFCTKVFG